MEVWQIILLVVGIILVLFITLAIIMFVKNDKVTEEHVWTDKKRTIFGLPLSFTRYILTERKLVTRRGLFTLHEDEIDLYRVIDKKLCIPLGQRMFGCGTIILTSKDTDSPKKELKSIKNVREVLNLIEKYVDAERTRYAVRGRDMIGNLHDDDVNHSLCDHDVEE